MLAYLCGVLLGLLAHLCLLGYLVFRVALARRLFRALPAYHAPPALSARTIARIRRALRTHRAPHYQRGESAVWLSALLQLLLQQLRALPAARDAVRQALAEGLFDALRAPWLSRCVGAFVLLDFDLGAHAPLLDSTQLLRIEPDDADADADADDDNKPLAPPDGSLNDTPLLLATHVHTQAPITLLLRVQLLLGFRATVHVQVATLTGNLALLLRQRALYVAFLERPRCTVALRCVLARDHRAWAVRVPWLDRLAARALSRALPRALTDPHFLGLWYRDGPPQPPYPWSPAVLAHPELLHAWTPP